MGHTVVSVGVGAGVWAATGSPLAVPVAVASGVLVDVDHLYDYYRWFAKGDRRHLVLPFHAWEYSAAGLVLAFALWYHPLAVAAVLGHLAHLVADHLANPTHRFAYFLAYRVSCRFSREQLMFGPPPAFAEVLRANVPFWRWIEPRLVGLFSGIRRSGS